MGLPPGLLLLFWPDLRCWGSLAWSFAAAAGFCCLIALMVLVAISALLTIVAGVIPSRMAARKDPVGALRTE